MIRPGDRVLVSLSGGQSSMALLHCLHGYQKQLLKEGGCEGSIFKMAAVIVDLTYEGLNLLRLVRYLQHLGVKHHYEKRGKYELGVIGMICIVGFSESSIHCSGFK